MSWQAGLITHIDDEGMSVKVPSGAECAACPGKMACNFQGPESAYRTLRVPRLERCAVGDRVLVEESGSVLALALVVFVALPIALMLAGYALAQCCVQFRFGAAAIWIAGATLWGLGLYLANRWTSRAARFQSAVRLATSRERRLGGSPEET